MRAPRTFISSSVKGITITLTALLQRGVTKIKVLVDSGLLPIGERLAVYSQEPRALW